MGHRFKVYDSMIPFPEVLYIKTTMSSLVMSMVTPLLLLLPLDKDWLGLPRNRDVLSL